MKGPVLHLPGQRISGEEDLLTSWIQWAWSKAGMKRFWMTKNPLLSIDNGERKFMAFYYLIRQLRVQLSSEHLDISLPSYSLKRIYNPVSSAYIIFSPLSLGPNKTQRASIVTRQPALLPMVTAWLPSLCT